MDSNKDNSEFESVGWFFALSPEDGVPASRGGHFLGTVVRETVSRFGLPCPTCSLPSWVKLNLEPF